MRCKKAKSEMVEFMKNEDKLLIVFTVKIKMLSRFFYLTFFTWHWSFKVIVQLIKSSKVQMINYDDFSEKKAQVFDYAHIIIFRISNRINEKFLKTAHKGTKKYISFKLNLSTIL